VFVTAYDQYALKAEAGASLTTPRRFLTRDSHRPSVAPRKEFHKTGNRRRKPTATIQPPDRSFL
jgi:hypothetical protein